MFGLFDSKRSSAKAYVSNGSLPRYTDPRQPPCKKKPYSVIMNQTFTHTVQLILPEQLHQLVWKDVEAKISNVEYSRAIMPLSALLEGDFFNVYIKTGNILMLSEGRLGTDDRYSLKHGELLLDLGKDNYERSGLIGKPVYDVGRKHIKTRYGRDITALHQSSVYKDCVTEVKINLRLPSMMHGKKGFERVVWAFKNVLNRSVTWLFHDLETPPECETINRNSSLEDSSSYCSDLVPATIERPLAKHYPTTHVCLPRLRTIKGVIIPNLDHSQALRSDDSFEEWSLEIYEWLSLLELNSPRVLRDDSIDPFLSRYRVQAGDSQTLLNLVAVTWTGLLPGEWIRSLFMEICATHMADSTGMHHDSFFSLNGYAYKTDVADQQNGFTILCHADRTASPKRSANDVEVEEPKGVDRSRDYVLWQFTCR